MHLLDQRTLGIVILLLLAMLVTVKRLTTGSVLKDTPQGGVLIWLTHVFNLFFLLIVNPLAAVLLITRQAEGVDPTHVIIGAPWLQAVLEAGGLALYVAGYLLMAWALVSLRSNYQAGGSTPRVADKMVIAGPYQWVRHPMYAAALCMSLGLAGLLQSLACLALFALYLVLIVSLLPIEEERLRRAYREQYVAYQREVRRLIPLVF